MSISFAQLRILKAYDPLIKRSVISKSIYFNRRSTSSKNTEEHGSNSSDDPGWPLRWKIAGGALIAIVVPWICNLALKNDPETREFVENKVPGGKYVVEFLRHREGGHFYDEDPVQRAFDGMRKELYQQPVSISIQLRNGTKMKLSNIDSSLSLTSIFNNLEDSVEDFEIDDLDDRYHSNLIMLESNIDAQRQGTSECCALHMDEKLAYARSWWDIAEHSKASKQTNKSGHLNNDATEQFISKHKRPTGTREAIVTDAQARIAHIEKYIDELIESKGKSSRSIDDIDEDIKVLRNQIKKEKESMNVRSWRFF